MKNSGRFRLHQEAPGSHSRLRRECPTLEGERGVRGGASPWVCEAAEKANEK